MTLAPDKIELAQQIADILEDRIDALSHVFFDSTYTKSDCCKHLIKPLPGEYQIDTLLESLPTYVAKPLRERYSKLMSCFDGTGELLNQDLSLNTVVRYVKDLIKELRNLGQGGKRKDKHRSKKKRNKSEARSIATRFTFRQGQVLFDGCDLNVGTGAALDIAKALFENFGRVIPFQKLDENSPKREASEKIRTAIGRLRKTIKSAKIPIVIENRKSEGYLILEPTR